MKPLEVIGLDVGEARTGIARGNTAAKLAEPLVTVKTNEIFTKLDELTAKDDIDALVVGLPRNLEGCDTPQTTWTRDWVKGAKSQLSVPIYWQDEALTSKQAQGPNPKSKSLFDEHAQAAAVILQDFLSTPTAERVQA